MKLYIREKVLTLRDKFAIKDGNGRDIFFVEGNFVSVRDKLHIYDENNIEVAQIHKKVLAVRHIFEVYLGDKKELEIIKEPRLLRNKYKINGSNWDIDGNILDHDYIIKDGFRKIITVTKKWISIGDTYEIDINEGCNVILAIATVLAIDCVLDEEN